MIIEILDEKVIYQNGPHLRVHRWLKGIHPHLGMLVIGHTGWETFVEQDVLLPLYTFSVIDLDVVPETTYK